MTTSGEIVFSAVGPYGANLISEMNGPALDRSERPYTGDLN
jgi:hypothetical protein